MIRRLVLIFASAFLLGASCAVSLIEFRDWRNGCHGAWQAYKSCFSLSFPNRPNTLVLEHPDKAFWNDQSGRTLSFVIPFGMEVELGPPGTIRIVSTARRAGEWSKDNLRSQQPCYSFQVESIGEEWSSVATSLSQQALQRSEQSINGNIVTFIGKIGTAVRAVASGSLSYALVPLPAEPSHFYLLSLSPVGGDVDTSCAQVSKTENSEKFWKLLETFAL